ncbi:MAG: prolipoprotein diacylglyceryl transferase [Gammaproteobacteria bacterium]|nr:prolipoprotein diacylglyceryl transferase [Gammaproteobacteria bacterium]
MVVDFDRVAFSLFGWEVHWYGLMYVMAFVSAWWLARKQTKRQYRDWNYEQIDDLLFYGGMGVILGGRLGYILFYAFPAFLENPLIIFRVWEGGMSFHGGLLGVLLAMLLFNRKYKKGYFNILDFGAPLIPLGLGFGRLGNFINGELWGKPTDLPWGMVFPAADSLPRHPNPLYEAFLEGLVLFVLLWWFSAKPRAQKTTIALFFIGYGIFRFGVEFVRVPDAHIGYLAWGWLTMGQILTVPIILAGFALVYFKGHKTE